jgi:hypothetical protein
LRKGAEPNEEEETRGWKSYGLESFMMYVSHTSLLDEEKIRMKCLRNIYLVGGIKNA